MFACLSMTVIIENKDEMFFDGFFLNDLCLELG